MENRLVSVIVVVKNGEAFLASAIKSVQEQDYRPLEIIVVDGQSEDGTAAIAQSFKDVRYFFQRNRGIADAYNVGLAAAQGEFVAFLSHDDMWVPRKLSLQVSYLLQNPTVQYTIGMIRFFLEPGHEIPRGFRRELFQGLHVGRIMETLLARRSLFDVIGDFDSKMALAEDVDWYARASDRAIPMAVISELLLQKRVHSRNASSDAQTSNRELLRALKRSIERKKISAPNRQTHDQRIQIYGERCSGTNYLECLISENLKGVQIRWDFGWKHFFSNVNAGNAADCLFVIIYRNPFDWLSSLHKNPWHAAPDLRGLAFSDFIRKEWWCIWDEQANKSLNDRGYGTEMLFERCPETHQRFTNVIQMRTAKIRDWESLRDRVKNSIYITYEDLSASPEGFINTISERFRLPRAPSFKDAQGYKGSSSNYVPLAYDAIKEEDLHYILNQLDVNLEASIGYDVKALAAQLSLRT